MGEGWKIRLLGPLEVRHDGVPIPIAAAKKRALIAVLALAAGEPVTVERLIAYLWDERPPAGARNALQNHVLRLRRILRADDTPCPLVSTTAGYHLDVPADAIDVHRFHTAIRSARSEALADDPESASALLADALALWRGDPLADVPSDLLHREVVPGLVEQRLTAQEQRIELGLRLGRHQELVTELVALTTAHPLRERMWAQLVLALYRSGRTAEALDAYRQAAAVLAEELGIDPGPELRDLHQAVLTNAPDLTCAAPTPEIGGGRPTASPAVASIVPRQLPAPVGHFVGRANEQRQLSARLETASGTSLMVISAIGGTAGIGKTALAVHWAHQHADHFPDGQLYVNLRGFDPSADPVRPTVAVRGFLTALGVPAQQIPADPDEQAALYRSRLAHKRVLVVLDNARDAEQVRPLLPGAPSCQVLVTSRDQLAGLVALDGAQPLTLDLLSPDEARDLLIRRLGRDRVEHEPAAVEELIKACARLPLALTIAAAHAALHPTRPLAALTDEVGEARWRLDTLTTGDTAADVRAVFSWSYRTLTPETARVFRLLGLHPGPDISLPAAASLAARELDPTRHALTELVRAHLITEYAPGRYTLHDLLRAYAADQAHTQHDQAERRCARRRLVDFYLHTACTADHLLEPHRHPIRLDPPATGTCPHSLPDVPTALAWLDTEHANLLAAQRIAGDEDWHLTVWQLAWFLSTFHARRGHLRDHVTMWQAALATAAHLPDTTLRIHAHRLLGRGCVDLGRHQEGIEHLRHALALAEDHDRPLDQAHIHHAFTWAWEQRGDDRQALHHATSARELYHVLNEPEWEADTLNTMGWFAARLGEYDTARAHCGAALALHRAHHRANGEADTLDSLGYIAHRTGHHQQAVHHYQQALALYRSLGHTAGAANTLDALGHPHAALGQHERARSVWREALRLYQQQRRDQDADRLRRQLDDLDRR